MPVSGVLGDDKVMRVWSYGDHLSTFAANPLGLAVAKKSVDVLLEEKMIENAERLGRVLEEEMRKWGYEFVEDV